MTNAKKNKNSYLSPNRKSGRDLQYHFMPFSKRKKEDRVAKKQTFWLLFSALAILILGFYFGIPIVQSVTSIWQKNIGSAPTDTTPPSPPQLQSSNLYTNQNQITVSGSAESGATIDLFNQGDDSHIANTLAGNDRIFTFDKIFLDTGANQMYAIATDQSGNKSFHSQTITINYLPDPPPLTITSPNQLEIIRNNTATITVSGYTNPECIVMVNDSQAILDNTNAFNFTLHNLKTGENLIKITSTDKAGNKTEDERSITYESSDS